MADKNTILQRLLSHISDIWDKSIGSFMFDTQKPLAIELESSYEKVDAILDNGFAATAKGEYLELKAGEQDIYRRPAAFAVGSVIITGDDGAVVNVGDKVSSDNITFSATENKTLTDGNAEVKIICDTAGRVGNLPSGSIKTFPVTLSGLVGVINTAPTTGGYDAETDDELRRRYFEKVRSPATSGNKYHYINWAKEVVGVGDAKVVPLWNGAGTVKVIIINSERQTADSNLISTVKNHIETNRPIGAEVMVESAEPKKIDISVKLKLLDYATGIDVLPDIRAVIDKYLKQISFIQLYVSYSHIGSIILSVPGVEYYTDLKVNGGTGNIALNDNQVPVLGVVVNG